MTSRHKDVLAAMIGTMFGVTIGLVIAALAISSMFSAFARLATLR